MQPDNRQLSSTWRDVASFLLLAVAVFLLFQTSPRAGDFWWSDAPRHAMDGVFYYDMARNLPITHLKRWAMDYYLQYPAITVLFFPPLFALIEAVFFGLFGVSATTAQLTVSVFLLGAAYGAYLLTRRWVGRLAALSVGLLFVGTPIMALWGRQVMLEIPAFAFLIWSCYFFFRYLDTLRARDLYLAVGFVVAGMYTKQPVMFIVAAYLLTLFVVFRIDLFRRSDFWWSTVLLITGVFPLAIFTWLWGRYNVQQSMGGDWVEYSRTSIAGWLYVARQWPSEIGWLLAGLAGVYCIGALLRPNWRLPSAAMVFFVGWIVSGYVFFTLIAIKSQRYTIFLVFPLVLFAVLALVRAIPARVGPYITIVLSGGLFAHMLLTDHVPYVSGYRAAAEYVCSVAPPDSVVLFSGLRDGSFIFNVKTNPDCKNLSIIRSDKLLLRVMMMRSMFGVKELGVSEAQFREMLGRYGVHYIVIEPDFWADLKSMQMLVGLLHEDQFKLLTKIPIVSNKEHIQSQLEIYENLGPVSQGKNLLRVELPVSGLTVEGEVGKQR
ncbi:MAG: glycosyltransferase family 39 protein [Candidatus Korobacteraceae bacterium]